VLASASPNLALGGGLLRLRRILSEWGLVGCDDVDFLTVSEGTGRLPTVYDQPSICPRLRWNAGR
jgi:hypothetical protein